MDKTARLIGVDAGKQVPPRRHDAGSGANETSDGLDATSEACSGDCLVRVFSHVAKLKAGQPCAIAHLPHFDRSTKTFGWQVSKPYARQFQKGRPTDLLSGPSLQ